MAGRLAGAGKRTELGIDHQVRPQSPPGDLHYLFAPLKRARLDYMVQKAVEMGVSRLQPVMTRHTQAERVNLDRMHANAIEAAEQCGILAVPEIMAPVALDRAIAALEPRRHLVFCDEDAPGADPVAALVRDLEQGGLGPGHPGAGRQARRAAGGADRTGRRIRRGGARFSAAAAAYLADRARAAHPARRHRRGGGARHRAGGRRRLAAK